MTTATAAPRAIGRSVRANLPVAELYERALHEDEGTIAADGALVVRTGTHTGRSPKDKFVVFEPATEKTVWWGDVNHP
ncbi:MAG TPA: phosphoenolpyruvate carboxykinase (ATP), partial [Candidatus Limnocylindria bacterium]